MVIIEKCSPKQVEVQKLLFEGDSYFAALYPAKSNHLLDTDSLLQNNVIFLVARIGDRVCGTGALVSNATDGEIKRMFVDPIARGQGIGRRLLEALEQEGRKHGLTNLRLETGIRQPEALALYRAYGYREIGPFGDYQFDLLSVFLEKTLSDPNL